MIMPSIKSPLSVVVIVRNEEKKLDACLGSVTWADEIIVVDDMSTDNTIAIARRYTDRIFTRKMDNEGRHRNWAYAQAKNKWVLSLDADEVVTPELKDEIASVLSADPVENGFTIPRRNYIGSHWVKYGGWYPSPQLRLFKKDNFKYEEVGVHPRAIMPGPCGHLKSDMLHFSYDDIAELVRSLNGQTTKEAEKWISGGRKMRMSKAIWRAIDRFYRAYIGKKGRRDGVIGLIVAVNGAMYQVLSYAKYRIKNAEPKT
ncbi:MAG: glycosyltransferase family 2 protein [Candidatus Omnitrophota bacterium]|jgi:glycosyltransferase involved in cell wall biosynthesis